MMNNTNTPPRFTRVLFPLKGNETRVDEAKERFGVQTYFGEYLLYEGYAPSDVRSFLSGGVCA